MNIKFFYKNFHLEDGFRVKFTANKFEMMKGVAQWLAILSHLLMYILTSYRDMRPSQTPCR